MFNGSTSITLDGYDKAFATAWRQVRAEEQRSIVASRFWKRLPPIGGGFSAAMSLPFLIVVVVWLVIGAGSVASAALGVFSGPVGAIAFGIVVPALAAYAMYRSLLPARSATGSALALRTESFRRFLAASEGRHVEWAWKHGVLREYSAWAVAPRRGVHVGAGDGGIERPAGRADQRSARRLEHGLGLLQRPHAAVDVGWRRRQLGRRWRRVLGRQRRWRWRRRQLRELVTVNVGG